MAHDLTGPLIVICWHGRPHSAAQGLVDELMLRDGWPVCGVRGSLGVDRTRSLAASIALQEYPDRDWWLWVDDDNWAPGDRVRKLVADAQAGDYDVLAAVVPCRSGTVRPNFLPFEDQEVLIGEGGGVLEVRAAGLAMAVTHRRVFERMRDHWGGWVDYEGTKGWPFFTPHIDFAEHAHYGEDYSWCMRVRHLGMRIHVDTSLVCLHDSTRTLGLRDLIEADQAEAAKAMMAAVVVD